MRRTVVLLGLVLLAALLASGVALAVVPSAPAAGDVEADASAAAKSPDASLDRALKKLIAMPGGPGSSPWSSAARVGRSTLSGLRT